LKGLCSGPNCVGDFLCLLAIKGISPFRDQEQINNPPDAAAAEGEKLDDPKATVSNIEPVNTHGAKNGREYYRDLPIFLVRVVLRGEDHLLLIRHPILKCQ
jgi:hypothetical protein